MNLERISKEAFKRLYRLGKKSYSDNVSTGFDILLEGERLIQQVRSYDVPFKTVYIREDKLGLYQSLLDEMTCPAFLLTEKQSDMLTETRCEQGIYAQVTFQTKPIVKYDRLVYLNGIADPGNLGTIIRTATAFDIDGLILDEGCCDLSNSKVVRASMGAVFAVGVTFTQSQSFMSLTETQRHREISASSTPPPPRFDGGGNDIIVTSTDKGVPIDKFSFPQTPYILVIGSEANGVSENITKLATQHIHIPMSNKMQSLNAAVATGILMYKMSTDKTLNS